ncbi:MAG: putative signal transducing protein [Flavobacteriaceae bacterium]
MDTQKHVLVYTADSEFMAQRINQNLAEENIAALLKDKYATDLNDVILGGQPASVDIFVYEADNDKAIAIIKEIINS